MNILFCDADIVVCFKPYGVLSQSSEAQSESMVSLLQSEIGGDIFPVHRLDRTTSGLMVFARNSSCAALLSRQITDFNFSKTYRALVHGRMEKPQDTFNDLLFFDRKKNKSFTVKRLRSGVKEASLSYELISETTRDGDLISDVSISLTTGRTHQIRVQFASRKHPLLGDRRYGASDSYDKIALCSCGLSFVHPRTKERLEFNINPEF